MKRRILSLALASIMVFTLSPMPAHAASNLSISIEDHTDTMVAGAAHPYTMVVSNSGDADLSKVWVDCTLPEKASNSPASTWEITEKTGSADITGGYGSSGEIMTQIPVGGWGMTLLSLPAGSSVTFTLSVNSLSNASGSFEISVRAQAYYPDSGTETATDTNTLVKKADLSVTINDNKTTLAPSESAPYIIRVTNNGPSDVSGVTLSCPLPTGATEAYWGSTGYYSGVSASPGNGSGSLNTTLALNSGKYYEFWYTVRTAGTASGSLAATATVTAPDDTPDPDASNNTQTDTDAFGNSSNADLALSMGFGDQTGNTAGVVTFFTNVQLITSGNATNIAVSVPLPAGVAFVGATADQGTYQADTGLWHVGALSGYGNAELVIRARVDDSAPRTVTASMQSLDQIDDDLSNNSASLIVTQKADLAITTAIDNAAPTVGGTVTITATLTNNGSDATQDMIVDATLPAGLEYISAAPSSGDYYPADKHSPQGYWYLDKLDSGDAATLQISARAVSTGIKTFSAQIIEEYLFLPDPNTADNSASVTFTVAASVGTPPIITTASLPKASLFREYNYTLSAESDTPVVWGLSGGFPNNGLSFYDGTFSGTPLTTGKFTIFVTATNSTDTVSKEFTLCIGPQSYDVNIAPAMNGSVKASPEFAEPGETVTLTILPDSGYKLNSITGAGADGTPVAFSGGGAGTTRTFTMPDCNVDITAVFESIPETGGGSGSGSGGGGTSIILQPLKKPDQPVVAEFSVTPTVGSNGHATVTIPQQSVADAIARAQADAKAQGKTASGIGISLNIGLPDTAKSLGIVLPGAALNSLVNTGVKQFEIGGVILSLDFDLLSLKEILKQSAGDITITIRPAQNLSDEARALIGTRPVYEVIISYVKDGKTVNITSLGSGSTTLFIPYMLGKNEAVGYLFGVYVNGSGKASRITNSAYDVGSGSLILNSNHFSVYGIGYTPPSAKLADISTHWAKESIDYVVGRELLTGTSETTFAPNTAMMRGMLVTALGRLAGVDVKSYTTSSFTDVKADSAFRPYIEWAYKKGIVQGIGNQQFAPDKAVTREEIAVIFANYAKATGYSLPVTHEATAYTDASGIGSIYKTAVTAMQQAGIMVGGTDNKFSPKTRATRAEVSAMLHRYIKLTIDPASAQGWAKNDAGQYLYYKNGKALTGIQTIDGTKYFFDTNGVLKTGWVKDGGNWRYYSGNKMLIGWQDIGSGDSKRTCYFNTYGVMVVGKWLQIDGKWYYFYADGSLARSATIDGYQIDENGVSKTK